MNTKLTLSQRILRFMSAVVRRDLFSRVEVSCAVEYHGSSYGEWVICPTDLTLGSRVYSLGVGEDISFDLSVIQSYGAEVFAFDPTPRSADWLASQDLPTPFNFQATGVADYDGTAKFHLPPKITHVSHSILSRGVDEAIEVPVRRLSTLMTELGHDHIDILKMDIEGAEYGVLRDLLGSELRPRQVLIEYHHRFPDVGLLQTADSVRLLHAHGYRIFYISADGQEYSFLHKP